jgi:hypothetical protein
MKTISCSAIFAVLLLAAAARAANPAPSGKSGVMARSHYYDDNSHTDTVLDMNVHEMEERTYDAHGALQMRKHYLVNDLGQPTQGNVYDGRNNLVARSRIIFDEFNRIKEMQTANLQGEVFQQIIYNYDANGKSGKPKVINYNTKTPTFRPATMDFTKVMPPPGEEQSAPVQGGQPMAQPVPGFQQGNAVQQGAPIYAPGAEPAKQEAPKKKSFWKKLFNKD